MKILSRHAGKLRIAVTIITFVLVLTWAGPMNILLAFSNVIWFWVIARLLPYVISLWFQAKRWQIFLRLEGIETDTYRLFRRIWMSRFFAYTLPGSLGGDVFRVIESTDYSSDRMSVAHSVILDRVVALVSLVLYTSIACLVWASSSNLSSLWWAALLGMIGAILGLLSLSTRAPGNIARWLVERCSPGRIQKFLQGLADSLWNLAGRPGLLVKASAMTILFNMTWATGSYFAFLALGLSISPWLVITLIPVVYTVTAIPISINGLGVSEGLFVVVFSTFGVTPAEAVAVALLLRVSGVLMSSMGGLLYLNERRLLKNTVS